MLLIPLVIVFLLSYVNGGNDMSKSVATLVGSGVSDIKSASLYGAVWTIIGAMIGGYFALSLIKIFTSGILSSEIKLSPPFPVAVASGTLFWVLFASWRGLPVSTTHSLTGAICGAGILLLGIDGIILSSLLYKIIIPLFLSPLIALFLGIVIFRLFNAKIERWAGICVCAGSVRQSLVAVNKFGQTDLTCIPTGVKIKVDAARNCRSFWPIAINFNLDLFHWISSGLVSLARGMNDAPKIIAVGAILGAMTWNGGQSYVHLLIIFAALAMGLGGYLGGIKVTDTLANRITRLDHIDGFFANITTAILVASATGLGLPVSTTHVSSFAITGMGLKRGWKGTNCHMLREIIISWLLTLPVTAILSAICYTLLRRVL